MRGGVSGWRFAGAASRHAPFMLALAQRKPTLPTFVLVRASTGSGSMPVCSHRPSAMRATRRRSEGGVCCGGYWAPAACCLPTLPS